MFYRPFKLGADLNLKSYLFGLNLLIMNQGKMVFAQVMHYASQDILKNIVKRYNGDYKKQTFSCWKHFLCMSFGQLTHRESMSDTMLMLKLNKTKLYHLGIGTPFDKSTVSRTNETRDWRIFQDFGIKLIDQAKDLYHGDNQLEIDLKGEVFSLDSTTIDLCLDVYWWANFRSTKAGIKVHTLLNSKTSIPEFIFITDASVHDVNILDKIPIEKGNYYVMDKAYVDFNRLYKLHRKGGYFVVRAKENNKYKKIGSRKVAKGTGIKYDWDVALTGFYSNQNYPLPLRRIKYFDRELKRTFVFYTNNRIVKPETIALLYKSRWMVELFFKWIKQNLKIQSFWGNNENAVRIQIWVAISTYVLVAIAKKKLGLRHSLYEILQYISIAPFEKSPLRETFSEKSFLEMREQKDIQLKIF